MRKIQNAEEVDEEMSAGSSVPQSDGSDGDAPIWPPRRKKRRKMAYFDFSKVVETFSDTSTDVICQLAEMEVIKPSNMLKLVPEATTEQIASFLHFTEEDRDIKKERAVPKEMFPN